MKKLIKFGSYFLAIIAFSALMVFNAQVGMQEAEAKPKAPEISEEMLQGNCIMANYRLGGVCSGATERFCEGPPECIKEPVKEE